MTRRVMQHAGLASIAATMLAVTLPAWSDDVPPAAGASQPTKEP